MSHSIISDALTDRQTLNNILRPRHPPADTLSSFRCTPRLLNTSSTKARPSQPRSSGSSDAASFYDSRRLVNSSRLKISATNPIGTLSTFSSRFETRSRVSLPLTTPSTPTVPRIRSTHTTNTANYLATTRKMMLKMSPILTFLAFRLRSRILHSSPNC